MAKHILIIQIFYENRRSFVNTQRALRKNYGSHNRPSVIAVWRIVEIFKRDFTTHDRTAPTRCRNPRNAKNFAHEGNNVKVTPISSIFRPNVRP